MEGAFVDVRNLAILELFYSTRMRLSELQRTFPQMSAISLRLGEGVSGWVAANRQVMINSEAALDLGDRADAGVPLKYALCAPLITRESLVGTITLYGETAFTESQSRLVQIVAPHLAQAVWASTRHDSAAASPHAQAQRASGAAASDLRLVSTR